MVLWLDVRLWRAGCQNLVHYARLVRSIMCILLCHRNKREFKLGRGMGLSSADQSIMRGQTTVKDTGQHIGDLCPQD